MRKKVVLLFILVLPLLVASGVTYWRLQPKPGVAVFKGMTATEWETELAEWRPVRFTSGGIISRSGTKSKSARSKRPGYLWWHKAACSGFWYLALEYVGFAPKCGGDLPANLVADADAIPVLIELLGSRKMAARLAAAQVLGLIGERAASAAPALVDSLDDLEIWVQYEVRKALWHIDRTVAVSAGLREDYTGEIVSDRRRTPDED